MSTKITQGELEAPVLTGVEHLENDQGISVDPAGGGRCGRHGWCGHHDRHKSGDQIFDLAARVVRVDRHTVESLSMSGMEREYLGPSG